MLYRVVEVCPNPEGANKPAIKKDIGCEWKSITQARSEMTQLKGKNLLATYGLEMK